MIPNRQLKVRTCGYCGKRYTSREAEAAKGRYCSRSCGAKMKSEKLSRSLKAKYDIVAGQAAKGRAKDRDGHRCVICGFDSIVHGHHIQPRAGGGSDELSNLVTLCPNHHAMAHAGMISAKELRSIVGE